MSEVFKILGQAAPSAATPTDLYTVPASTYTVVSTLNVCNQNGSSVAVRVWIAIGGAATVSAQYLLYDTVVVKNMPLPITGGWTLSATDVVRVQADTTGVSFNLFGTEFTP